MRELAGLARNPWSLKAGSEFRALNDLNTLASPNPSSTVASVKLEETKGLQASLKNPDDAS